MLAAAWATLALPVVAIFLALVAGAVVIILSSALVPGHTFDPGLPVTAYQALFEGSLGSDNARVETLVQAAPLLLAALGIGLGFKAGLFNIGGKGQFLMGALAAVAAAGALQDAGPAVAITVSLLVGCAAGALWGFLPGFLKAVSGAHEVVTTIMLNFVAQALVAYLVAGPLRLPKSPQPVTGDVGIAALPIILGRDGHIGIIIAAVAVPVVWFLLYRTTLGFQIRAVGANPDASRYAGMRPRWVIILTMTAAGLFSGLAGAGNILGINHQVPATFNTTVGFDAITVALLGRSHPFGILLASLLFGGMRAGAALMQIKAGVPKELVDVVQSIILLFLVASPIVRRLLRLRGVKASLGTTDTMSRTYGSETIR
jgi:simple sugar transport system permease protein